MVRVGITRFITLKHFYKVSKTKTLYFQIIGWGSTSHSSAAQMPNKLQVRTFCLFALFVFSVACLIFFRNFAWLLVLLGC